MPFSKILLVLFLTIINLNAFMQEDIVFVEDKSSNKISLKDEFLKPDSKYYTINVTTLDLNKYDPIEYFKKFNLTNAVAYKIGDNKNFAKIISGVYNTEAEATKGINSDLDPKLKVNKPFPTKLVRHQGLFAEYNGEIKVEKKIKVENKEDNELLTEGKNSIFITNSEESKKLKEEFLNKNSNYYTISVGSIPFNKNSIQKFFKLYDIGDKALAHLYGKNKNMVRIIYGLYKTKDEARDAIKNFSTNLKDNMPYTYHIKKFQHFYSTQNFDKMEDKNIVELKITKKEEEKKVKPKISDEIKIVKAEKKEEIKKPEIKKVEKKHETPKKKIEEKPKREIVKPVKKVVKQQPKKEIKKRDPNQGKYIKEASLEDVYYVEEVGDFNILTEVFLNDDSSFFTIDFGELKLNKTSIEEFFTKNGMKNEALAYKYGDKKEYARVIYGAFETKEAANNVAEKLNVTRAEDLRVSNIKNHQKLYKMYHKNIKPKKEVSNQKSEKKRELDSTLNDSSYTVVYSQIKDETSRLKEEFFDRDSNKYTITLITFLKDDIKVERYFELNDLYENTLAYPLGTQNSYYRIISGVYNNWDEATVAIDNLSEDLKRNTPYVSRIRTNQKKFESHHGRVLESELKKVQKIEFR